MSTRYFPVVSVLLFVLSIIAFSDNLFTDVGQPSNGDPKFIIRGLCCLAWFAFFVAQSMFIQCRRAVPRGPSSVRQPHRCVRGAFA